MHPKLESNESHQEGRQLTRGRQVTPIKCYKSGQSYWTESLQLREKALEDAVFLEKGSPAVACDETLRIFEEDIKAVTDTLLPAFKERRNAASPTAKFPAEVLVLIFKECQSMTLADLRCKIDLGRVSELWGGDPAFRLARKMCAQVCRRWRSIVLRTPLLWKDISVESGPDLLPTMLSRAGSFPEITFFGRLLRRWEPLLLKGIPPTIDFSRASEISLHSHDNPQLLASFLNNYRVHAPHLKILKLSSQHGEHILDSDRPPLPRFLKNSPQLQCIVLENLPVVDWKPLSGPANHLVRLEVVNYPAFSTAIIPNRIGDALKLLECTSALETLALVNCFPTNQPDSTVGPASAPVATLPRLRRLILETSMRNGLYLLDHVDFPGETRVRAQLCGGIIDEPTIISLVQRAFRYFHPGTTTTPPGGSFAFLKDPTTGMQVLGHFEPHIPLVSPAEAWEEMRAETDVSLTFITQFHGVDPDNVLRAAADALPESFALSLALSCTSADVWRALAQRFPRAREITAFGRSAAIALGGALKPTARSVKSVPFPALAHLQLLASQFHIGELHRMLVAFRARMRLNRRLGRLSVNAEFHEADMFMYSMQEVADDVGKFEEGYGWRCVFRKLAPRS